MNKDKIIKDLKERNDKLAHQYRLRDIRCVHLEMENEKLQKENKQLKEDRKKAIEYFKYQLDNLDFYENIPKMLCAMGITLLQEGDKENE